MTKADLFAAVRAGLRVSLPIPRPSDSGAVYDPCAAAALDDVDATGHLGGDEDLQMARACKQFVGERPRFGYELREEVCHLGSGSLSSRPVKIAERRAGRRAP